MSSKRQMVESVQKLQAAEFQYEEPDGGNLILFEPKRLPRKSSKRAKQSQNVDKGE